MNALAALPRPGRPRQRSGPGPVPVLAVPAAVAVGVVVTLTAVLGTGGAGRTDVILNTARGLHHLAACGVVGCLMGSLWASYAVLPGTVARLLLGRARRWAAAWCGCAVVWAGALVAQVQGPEARLAGWGVQLQTLLGLGRGRALLAVVVVAAGVALAASRRSTGRRLRVRSAVLLIASVTALSALASSGHATSSAHHALAELGMSVHVLAVTAWVGGLVVLLAHVPPILQARAAEAVSTLALLCYLLVAFSGIFVAWARLGSVRPEAGPYVGLLAAKAGVLVVLGAAGAAHRRWTLRRAAHGDRWPFAVLAVTELGWMGAAAGLAVALAGSSPPASSLTRGDAPHAASTATVDAGLPAPGWSLVTEVRPDAFIHVLAVSCAVALVVAWRQGPRGRGSLRRAVTGLGAALVLSWWALGGALAAYAAVSLAAQVSRILLLALVVPVLVAWSLPALGPGDGDSVRGRLRPADGLVVLVLALSVVLSTPVLDVALGSVALHVGLGLALLAAGVCFFVPLITGRSDTDAGTLLVVLAVVLGVAAVLVKQSGGLVASASYRDPTAPWVDAARDADLAAALLGAGSMVVLGVAMIAAPLLARCKRTMGNV